MLDGTRMGERYLDSAIADLIRSLADENGLSAEDRRTIEAALLQPSEQGRQNYARKLAEEAEQVPLERVKIA
jgi:hypothetical protein